MRLPCAWLLLQAPIEHGRAAMTVAAPFGEAAQWAAKSVPEACDQPGEECEAWDQVASTWRYAWNNLRLSLQHATAQHRLRLDPGEVQQLVAVHEFMYWLGKDKQKWQVGWDEMSGSARALLRALQLWLVPGEYQLGTPLIIPRVNHGLHLPFASRSVLVPTDGDVTSSRISLSDGRELPLLGFSLGSIWAFPYQATKVYQQIRAALKLGYRHLDLSEHYGSEKEVHRAIEDAGIPREEIFLAGKLGKADHYPLGALRAVQQQMKHFDLEYLDLFLLTKPIYDAKVLRSVWEILESYQKRGIFRSLGVCNFDITSLQLLEQVAKIPPVYVQSRFSIYDLDLEGFPVLRWARPRGIAVAARMERGGYLLPTEDPHVVSIAKKLKRNPGEVLSRWLLQLGMAVVVSDPEEQRGALDFQLQEEEMRLLNGLVTLSSSVPGIPGPGFAEDVYGLRRFDQAKEAQAAGDFPDGFSKPFAFPARAKKSPGAMPSNSGVRCRCRGLGLP